MDRIWLDELAHNIERNIKATREQLRTLPANKSRIIDHIQHMEDELKRMKSHIIEDVYK